MKAYFKNYFYFEGNNKHPSSALWAPSPTRGEGKIEYTNKISLLLLVFLLSAVYVGGWLLQTKMVFSSDVSWLIHAASWIVAGESYAAHFFETNPPLIMYLYTPVLGLTKYFHLTQATALKLYVYGLATLSLCLCYLLLKKIFSDHAFFKNIFLLTLAAVYLILPLNEFGQREHLLILLTMPYFLLLIFRLQKNNPTFCLTFLIGCLAGLGFAIKPYFYAPLFLVESYFVWQHRSLTAFLRTEIIVIFTVAVLYLNLILLRHADYITVILPLIVNSYYQKYQASFKTILLLEWSFFAYSTLLLFIIGYRSTPYKQVAGILFLAFLGFYLQFLLQHMGWYYHALPFYSISILLTVYLFCVLLTKPLRKIERHYYLMYALAMSIYFIWQKRYIALDATFTPIAFFLYFSSIFSLTIYVAANYSSIQLIIRLSLLLLINIVFFNYIYLPLYHYVFVLSSLLLILSFILLIPSTDKEKGRYFFISTLGLLALVLPFHHTAYLFNAAVYYQHMYATFTQAMQPYKNKRVYYFTTNSELVFPVVYDTAQQYVSRLWSLSWLPLLPQPEKLTHYPAFYQAHKTNLDFYITTILDDFTHYQPEYVFVDIRERGKYLFSVPPNYLVLFSENPAFKNAWKNYHYVKTLNRPPLYKFAVYKRG